MLYPCHDAFFLKFPKSSGFKRAQRDLGEPLGSESTFGRSQELALPQEWYFGDVFLPCTTSCSYRSRPVDKVVVTNWSQRLIAKASWIGEEAVWEPRSSSPDYWGQ